MSYGDWNFLTLVTIFVINLLVGIFHYHRLTTLQKQSSTEGEELGLQTTRLWGHVLWTFAWLAALTVNRMLQFSLPLASWIGDVGSVLLLGVYFAYTGRLQIFKAVGPALALLLGVYALVFDYFSPGSIRAADNSTGEEIAQQAFHASLAYMPSLSMAVIGIVTAGSAFFRQFGWSAAGIAVVGAVYSMLQVPAFLVNLFLVPWEPDALWWPPLFLIARMTFTTFYWLASLATVGLWILEPRILNPWVQLVAGLLGIIGAVIAFL